MKVVVVPTGTANIASVVAGFSRLGAEPVVSRRVDDIDSAERVVLPGVGSFGAAVDAIEAAGLRETLRSRFDEGRPTLAICVGMQLLAESSEESHGAVGLGVAGCNLRRFPDDVLVPQLGWNEVRPSESCRFVDPGWAYFANSYRYDFAPDGWAPAFADHGGQYVAALERDGVLACQFHPELSGNWGSAVLGRWLMGSG